jgi:ABC-type glutathione transport system ATPase component
VLRLRKERLRLVDLDDLAFVHERHAVRHLPRESHFVRDDDHGHAVLREGGHGVEHLLDHLGIEGRGRLVEQHDARAHAERAGDGDALLLAARELAGKLVRVLAQTDAFEQAHAHKHPGQLSGGQQQRVAIARALAMDPICMLFDEPTSALDPEMINEVLDVMVELAQEGMTMMCVTHEMGFARKVAHRVIFMDHGRIVEDAKKDDFFGTPRSERAQVFLSKILSH